MIALSIRQPWAWHILYSGKDVEKRNWPTRVRGRVLIHASKGMTRDEYEDGQDPLWSRGGPTIELPDVGELQRGGIVGSVEIVDCVSASESPWFFGLFGFVLRDPKPLPFVPWRGRLGFFDVPKSALTSNAQVKPGRVAEQRTWQALPAMLFVERNELGLNALLGLTPAAHLAEQKAKCYACSETNNGPEDDTARLRATEHDATCYAGNARYAVTDPIGERPKFSSNSAGKFFLRLASVRKEQVRCGLCLILIEHHNLPDLACEA